MGGAITKPQLRIVASIDYLGTTMKQVVLNIWPSSVYAFVAIAATLIAAQANAQQCNGNACSVITVQKRNGCIILANSSDKLVEVQIMNIYYKVYAHSEEQPTDLSGRCWSQVLSINANYK